MLQDLLGHIYKPLGANRLDAGRDRLKRRRRARLGVISSYQGVSIRSAASIPLAAVRNCQPATERDRALRGDYDLHQNAWSEIRLGYTAPLAWLISVTFTAGWEKIFLAGTSSWFLAQATALQSALAAGKVAASSVVSTQTQIFNNRLDAAVCGVFHGAGRNHSARFLSSLVRPVARHAFKNYG